MSLAEYEPCYLAFLDILGFGERVKATSGDVYSLNKLLSVMRFSDSFPNGEKVISRDGENRRIEVQYRFFSDTICIYIRQNKADLADLLLIVRFIQDVLWKEGICLRGSLVVGEMYLPKRSGDITLGPAIVEAHELEANKAKYPRILISEDLVKEMSGIKAFPFGVHGSLLENFICDDGEVSYLDLLNDSVIRKENEFHEITVVGRDPTEASSFSVVQNLVAESSLDKIVACVKKCVRVGLAHEKKCVREKYIWLQDYLSKSKGSSKGSPKGSVL